jgi:predicted NodU family carbamoyl transferase
MIDLNDRGTFGVAIELKHPCYESAAGKRFSKELLAQNNATYQQISPKEQIAYKEAHMAYRFSSHAVSPVNQQLVVTRPSSHRTTTAGTHPKDGHYAPSDQ